MEDRERPERRKDEPEHGYDAPIHMEVTPPPAKPKGMFDAFTEAPETEEE
jgi:hypothetical protein